MGLNCASRQFVTASLSVPLSIYIPHITLATPLLVLAQAASLKDMKFV